MNQYKLIIISLFILCACNNVDKRDKKIKPLVNALFLKETNDSTKSTKQILNHFLPSVLVLAKVDTSSFYYGNDVIEEDSISRQLLIGKFIDKSKVIATEINTKDTIISFYSLNNTNWKLIGHKKTAIPVYKIDFEDLNGDDKNEIIISTSSNMNGNSWKEVYCYSDKTNTIQYAGSFSTNYVVKKDKKQIEETYEGSSYMDPSQTLYEWRNEKLVPIKRIILVHKSIDKESNKSTFKYYENSTNDIDGLKLKFKEPYNQDNKKQTQLWDHFFD